MAIRGFAIAAFALISLSCSGPQSALDPAGHGAQWIADMFWWMTGSAAVIWLAVIVLAIWAARSAPEKQNRRRANLMIIGCGAVVPTLALALLLLYGLAPLPALLAPAPPGSLLIEVSGEQWWWRVRYRPPGAAVVSVANEIRLPVGAPVQFHLESPDVVHSFWIPPLGGKIDMIPGRVTRLVLTPNRSGTFRGACAEYCGTSHALMAFPVVVMEPADFARWLTAQALPAQAPTTALAARGLAAFLESGCGACHSIRGTSAAGVIGPDLTHVGSRLSLGAGILPNTPEAFVRWLKHADKLKPGVHMPGFGMLAESELQAVAAYLDGLE
ncbi:MAG TPA: cytochrome c oxidase subunit II [Candidatus Deferrimicrobium sp.]|nr:cytochrome c oxidase subunit II [Candidatus Deferrimicrobium sp.]